MLSKHFAHTFSVLQKIIYYAKKSQKSAIARTLLV